MEQKHTKGPWIVEAKAGREEARGYWLHDDDGNCIAMVCRRDNEREELPNASLVAAAPDMLEALRSLAFNAKAMRAFEYEIRDVAGHTNWQCLIDAVGQAEAAITRATTSQDTV